MSAPLALRSAPAIAMAVIQQGRDQPMGPEGPAREEDLRAGMRLAALATGAPVPAERLPTGWLAPLPETSREERLAEVQHLAKRLRPVNDPSKAERTLPPRALTLLAATAPRAYATRWAAMAAPPRSGARPPGLRAFLWALSEQSER